MGAIPWAAWIAHGIGALRLDPQAFWRMSVSEWRAVLSAARAPALTRGELDELMQDHPDAQ